MMPRPRHTIAFVMLIVITSNHCSYVFATSSPSSSSSALTSNKQSLPSTSSNINDSHAKSTQTPSPSNSHPQVVTFLYELYEHEIYNPNTGSWGSRRFTQSRESGGGGRDYQSLDPQTCSPPRGTVFEGEWKIDVKGTGETRDGFGWEYYVGKYDGLGRRRRRWLRNLRRVGGARARSSSSAYYNQFLKRSRTGPTKETSTTTTPKSSSKSKSKTNTKQHHQLNVSTQSTGMLKGIQQQYHFQGFGWSFFKSLISKRSMGASLRIPISANFDFYDKNLAWPVITTTTYFGYPWVLATFLNASLPLEAIQWFVGGILWKITWTAAILSACLRGIAEGIFSMLMLPWTIFQAFVQLASYVKARLYKIFVYETEDQKIAQSLMESVGGEEESDVDATTLKNIDTNVDSYVELSSSSSGTNAKNGTDDGDIAAVLRGGASGKPNTKISSSKSKRKKYVTLFGHEIPTFHRTNSIEYSTTKSERVGICVSWRVSKEHGYEYRWNFFYSCLPTLEFWDLVDEARKRKINNMNRRIGVWGLRKPIKALSTSSSLPSSNSTSAESINDDKLTSLSSSTSKPSSKFYSFLEEHSASLGYSAGWPLPVEPYFSFSLLLSLSGFYYGWLLKSIRSLFLFGTITSKKKADKESSTGSELLTEESVASTAGTTKESVADKHSSISDMSKEALANDEAESESDVTVDETESEEEGLPASTMDPEESSDDTTKVLVKRKA